MIDQLFIGVFGVASIWLANDPRPNYRRWACVAGLIAQPAWFWSAWHAQQFGIFVLAFFYTAGWIRGIRTNWLGAEK